MRLPPDGRSLPDTPLRSRFCQLEETVPSHAQIQTRQIVATLADQTSRLQPYDLSRPVLFRKALATENP